MTEWQIITRLDQLADAAGESGKLLAETMAVMSRLESHVAQQNGLVAKMNEKQLHTEGALAAMRWLMTVVLGMVTAGAAVAGIVLAILAKGG